MKENPYEDIELHGRCLGKKCVLTFPGSPTSSIPDTSAKVPQALRSSSSASVCLTQQPDGCPAASLSAELPKIPLSF